MSISQEELAGRAGLHRTYISDIERGARNVSLISIDKLARALEISTAALFSYELPASESGSAALGGDSLVDILLVEDSPEDAEMTTEALKGITNWVQVVEDGQAALDFLFCTGQFAYRHSNQRPQLVLLDLRVPKVDGLEVLRRIKFDPRTAVIPVVVLTGSDRERDLRTCKRLGAAAYIVKPVEISNLAHVTPMLHFQWALIKPPPPAIPQATLTGTSAV